MCDLRVRLSLLQNGKQDWPLLILVIVKVESISYLQSSDHLQFVSRHLNMAFKIIRNNLKRNMQLSITHAHAFYTLNNFSSRYSMWILTPTWPLCKNILSIEYKR